MKYTIVFIMILLITFSGCKDDKKTRKRKSITDTTSVGIKDTLDRKGPEGVVIETSTPGSSASETYNEDLPRSIPIQVEGFIKGGANANVILDELGIGTINPLQSVVIDKNGIFGIAEMIPEPGIYALRFGHGSIHLFLRGGHVKVNADINNLRGYEVFGSPESYHLKEMYLILDQSNRKTYAVQDRLDILKKDKTRIKELISLLDSLNTYYREIDNFKYNNLKKFINRIDTSMVAILAAFYLDPFENYRFLKGVKDKFSTICPNSKFYKQLRDKIEKIIPVNKGDTAPDIIMETLDGKQKSLSSLKGKYVLINFWASYEQPSRDENQRLKTIYEKYKNKGFEIYGISLDEEKAGWAKALSEDNTEWIQLADLVGWDCPTSQTYRVNGLPYNILINKQGTIISRGTSANEIDKQLRMLLH